MSTRVVDPMNDLPELLTHQEACAVIRQLRQAIVELRAPRAPDEAALDRAAEAVAEDVMQNGLVQGATRLLMVKEALSGDARVSNALYLGGYSRDGLLGQIKSALRRAWKEEA